MGPAGADGATGPAGAEGPMGPAGPTGADGESVVAFSEPPGSNCTYGGVGYTLGDETDYVCDGAPGAEGPMGPEGPQGPTGGLMAFAYFYALMPPDISATVAVGAAVDFPQDGPLSGGIARTGPNTFALPSIGVYEVFWQVSIVEAGQLILALDSGSGPVEVASTVVGRATGTSQIVNSVLIQTSAPNTILTIRNPTGNPVALTVTPLAGGTHPVSATLVIKQIQ